jgi:TonB family protein
MRVLVVDQDSTLLTAITRTLGEYFSIDAVTTKADCLDLVRFNEFEVIVAGERLEDGSGLELLGSLARSRPDMLRIFAAERERLKLLKGRLGPFGLFRTLSYPIEPRQLLAALSAAAGIEEEVEEATEAQDSAPPPSEPEPAAPAPVARRAAPSSATAPTGPTQTFSRTLSQAAASVSTSSRAQPQGAAAVSTASRPPPQTFTFAPPPRAPASSSTVSRAQVATPAPSRTPAPTSRGGGPTGDASAASVPRQAPRQPTPAALAAASKLDIVARQKGFPPPADTSPARSAFVVGAGVILVLGGLALSFKIFNTKDDPVKIATNAAAVRSPHFPPEVVKLVADTEVAFQQDDFKTARTDVAALQQIAPDHPRLPFFESLLKRLETTTQGGPRKMFARHTSAPTASGGSSSSATQSTSGSSTAQGASRASAASGTSRVSSAQQSDTQRRQPDTDRDSASATAVTAATATTSGTTFSGRTLEDTSATTPTQPPGASSQAPATPSPRRPGSAATPSDTEEPRLIQRVAADYPPEAARKGIEGSVDVSFTVTPQGKVSDVTVVNAVPSDIFNRAAITAVRHWKYEPKMINGVPVEAHEQLRVQFKLAQSGQ